MVEPVLPMNVTYELPSVTSYLLINLAVSLLTSQESGIEPSRDVPIVTIFQSGERIKVLAREASSMCTMPKTRLNAS